MDRTKRYCKLRTLKKKKRNPLVNMPEETNDDQKDSAKFKLDRFIADVKKYADKVKNKNEKDSADGTKNINKVNKSKLHVPSKRGIFENAILGKTAQAKGNDAEDGRNNLARLKGDLSSLISKRLDNQESNAEMKTSNFPDESFNEAHSKIVNRIICGSSSSASDNHGSKHNAIIEEEFQPIQMGESSKNGMAFIQNPQKISDNESAKNMNTMENRCFKSSDITNNNDTILPHDKSMNNLNSFHDVTMHRDAVEGRAIVRPAPTREIVSNHQCDINAEPSNNAPVEPNYSEINPGDYGFPSKNSFLNYFTLSNFIHPIEELVQHNMKVVNHMSAIAQNCREFGEKQGYEDYNKVLKKALRGLFMSRKEKRASPGGSSTIGSDSSGLLGSEIFQKLMGSINKLTNSSDPPKQKEPIDVIDLTNETENMNSNIFNNRQDSQFNDKPESSKTNFVPIKIGFTCENPSSVIPNNCDTPLLNPNISEQANSIKHLENELGCLNEPFFESSFRSPDLNRFKSTELMTSNGNLREIFSPLVTTERLNEKKFSLNFDSYHHKPFSPGRIFNSLDWLNRTPSPLNLSMKLTPKPWIPMNSPFSIRRKLHELEKSFNPYNRTQRTYRNKSLFKMPGHTFHTSNITALSPPFHSFILNQPKMKPTKQRVTKKIIQRAFSPSTNILLFSSPEKIDLNNSIDPEVTIDSIFKSPSKSIFLGNMGSYNGSESLLLPPSPIQIFDNFKSPLLPARRHRRFYKHIESTNLYPLSSTSNNPHVQTMMMKPSLLNNSNGAITLNNNFRESRNLPTFSPHNF